MRESFGNLQFVKPFNQRENSETKKTEINQRSVKKLNETQSQGIRDSFAGRPSSIERNFVSNGSHSLSHILKEIS